jgi:tetratricopeptide (TPR) repeat protein
MKKIVSVIFVLNFLLIQLFSAKLDVDSVFDAGNQAYIEKRYNEAISNYETLTNNGFRSAELFYNTGNANFKSGNYAKAILFYERAKLIEPGNGDIDFNLAKARTYVIDKIEIIPDFFIKSWFKSTISNLSSNSWAVLSVFAFVVFMILFLIYLLIARVNIKKFSFYVGVLLLLISIVSLTFAFKTRQFIDSSNGAIVMYPTVTVKSSPDMESADAFIIHEGTKVFIIRSLNGWNEIKLTDGKQGWLESQTIEKI